MEIVITKHIGGHPASFESEAKDGPQHQDGDIVWNHSQDKAWDRIHYVGHEKTELSAKPADTQQKHIRWGLLSKEETLESQNIF